MTWRVPDEGGPEPLPPRELLRLREELRAAPRPEVRRQHVAAASVAAGAARGPAAAAHAMARRGARVIAGVAGIIVVSSGLAGAQILPEPARSLTAAVSERFAPSPPEPEPAEVPVTGDVEETVVIEPARPERDKPTTTAAAVQERAATSAPATTTSTPASTSSTSSSSSTSSTSSSTTTSEPDPSTTTTSEPDPTSTTTTSEPDPTSTTTTSTTAPSDTGAPPVPPAFAQDGSEDGGGR